MKTMKYLSLQLRRANPPSHRSDHTEHYQPFLVDPTRHDALVELGQSICRRGIVPDSLHTSPSNSQDSLRAPPTPPDGPNRPHVQRSATARPRPRRPSSSTSRPASSYSRPASSIDTLRSEPIDPPRPRQPPSPPTAHPVTRPSESSAGPQQSRRILRFNKEKDVDGSIDGCNASSWGGYQPLTALRAQTLDANIISIYKAREFGLDIKMLGPTDGVVFDFGTGRLERSVGKTVLQWNRSRFEYDRTRYPPLTVVCDVCENSEIGLVLGRPFFVERGLRWSTTKAK
jgi:hypothetical protein